MKKLFLLFFVIGFAAQAQHKNETTLEFQQRMNEEFSSEETSPLTKKDLKKFKELSFFKIDSSFIVKAKFIETPDEQPFVMATTTSREPVYIKYGEVHFQLGEKDFQLNVYQNQRLVQDPEYKEYLFIPFTDLTNGNTSYAGGRYLEFAIPDTETVVLNFNKAYNPYCAYNSKYSCPIPPSENHLDYKVTAGVKKFKKGKKH